MTEQDIKNLKNIAIEGIKKGVTPEEAIESFKAIGLIDQDGNPTEVFYLLGKSFEASRLNKHL